MVFSILEPVFAGALVSLINRYLINGSAGTWLQNWCVPPDDTIDEHEELDEEGHSMSSTTFIFLPYIYILDIFA